MHIKYEGDSLWKRPLRRPGVDRVTIKIDLKENACGTMLTALIWLKIGTNDELSEHDRKLA